MNTAIDTDTDYLADMLVVAPERGWKPKDCRETPPKFRLLWIEESGVPLEHALALQHGFNGAAIRDGVESWLLVVASWNIVSTESDES